MRISTVAKIRGGKLELDRNQLQESISRLKDGSYLLELGSLDKRRSNQQNKYYWSVIIGTLCEYTGYAPEEMHEALKMKFLGITGDKIPKLKSSADLQTSAFEEYLENIRRWAAVELNVSIQEPNEK